MQPKSKARAQPLRARESKVQMMHPAQGSMEMRCRREKKEEPDGDEYASRRKIEEAGRFRRRGGWDPSVKTRFYCPTLKQRDSIGVSSVTL